MFSWRKRSIDYLWLAFSMVLDCSRDWKRDFVQYRWNPSGIDWVSSVDVLVWTAKRREVERRAAGDEDEPVWEFVQNYWWNQWSTETPKERKRFVEKTRLEGIPLNVREDHWYHRRWQLLRRIDDERHLWPRWLLVLLVCIRRWDRSIHVNVLRHNHFPKPDSNHQFDRYSFLDLSSLPCDEYV